MKCKYTLWENTPLKFYRVLCTLLPFSCVLGTIYFFYTLVTTYVYYESPLFWLDISFRIFMLVLLYMSNICLRKREWLGVRSFLLYGCVICLFELIADYYDNASLGTCIGRILGMVAILVPVYIYFQKRRLLFEPSPYPIYTDDPTDGSIVEESSSEPQLSPKKPLFERYDTYISCPSCGSLVPKGTKQCECGYDLSGPATRIWRSLRGVAPIMLCILLVIAGTAIGYYAGQKSMDSELIVQYEAGEESGYLDGFRAGLNTNSDNMKETINKNYKKVFEDAYRTALADNATGTYGRQNIAMLAIKFDFPGRDLLYEQLAKEYGFSKYIEKPRLSGN